MMSEETVAEWIRIHAGVTSRRDLQADTDGGRWFMRIRDLYLAERAAA